MRHEHYGDFSVAEFATKRDGLDLHFVPGRPNRNAAGEVFVAERRSENQAMTAACGSSALKG
jgi:hypothetical protein